MEASKGKQRGVVRFLMIEGAGTRSIKSKRPGMLSDGIIILHDNARPYTANLVRDRLQRFDWETRTSPYSAQIFPLVTSTFLAT